MMLREQLDRLVGPSLWQMVPRDHHQSEHDFKRRRWVALGTLVVGAAVLAVSLRTAPGSRAFIPSTVVLAAVWTIGAFLSGPLHLGRIGLDRPTRPVVQPIAVGLALIAVFVVGALVIRQIPFLREQVHTVLAHADQGAWWLLLIVTVLNGFAEELFFRGALYAALVKNQVPITTVLYTVVTLGTGNVMLAFAAVILGLVVALQRRASGGILASMLTHVIWSGAMLFLLPLLIS